MARPPPRPIEERHWPELYGRSLPPPPDPAGEILAASAGGAVKTASSGAAFALSAGTSRAQGAPVARFAVCMK